MRNLHRKFQRFRRMFSRSALEREEVNILRGLLKSLTTKDKY